MPKAAFWSGWIMFAAVMMGLMGAYNIFQGLAAVFSDSYYLVTEDELLILDFTTWGVIMLSWGVLLLLGAIGLYSGKAWARWFALAIVGLNAVAQSGFFAAFPLWSIVVIALSVLVIFGLTTKWDEAQEDLSRPA